MTNPYDDASKLAQLFRRFEYALKRTKYLKEGRREAQADWEAFAKALGDSFFDQVLSSKIANTLITEPPRKLMAELDWKPDQPPRLENVVNLFVQGVCRVRNSYIHGEKFVSKGDQWERDAMLVHEALTVLELAQSKALVELSNEVL